MKIKIKRKSKPISVYLTEEQHKKLVKVTDEANESITDWVFDAIERKHKALSTDLLKEADRLARYWEKRSKELKESIEKDNYNNWVNGKFDYKD